MSAATPTPSRLRRTACVTALCVLLTACALSPQVIEISPKLPAQSSTIGGGKRIALTIVDLRPGPLIGRRGGVYKETATLHSQDDIRPALSEVVAQALRGHGFTVSTRDDAATRLRVAVEKLSYAAQGTLTPYDVDLDAAIVVTATAGAKTLEKRYTQSSSKEMLSAPGAEENRQLVNGILASLLVRMLEDAELLDLLSG